MGAKRFTDSGKWRNPWYRKLPVEAKLAWVYMCDECDVSGVWKPDFELASFQLGFDFDIQKAICWFGDKIRPFRDCILIVQFFEFQYGDTKDTWSAKIKAKRLLESLGFVIKDNKIVLPSLEENKEVPPTVGVQSPHGGVDVLSISKGRSRSIGRSKSRSNGEKIFDFEIVYKNYPLKRGKAEGIARLHALIKTQDEFDQFVKAVEKYRKDIQAGGTEKKFIKHFSSFVGSGEVQPWKDWLDDDAGSTIAVIAQSQKTFNRAEQRSANNQATLEEFKKKLRETENVNE